MLLHQYLGKGTNIIFVLVVRIVMCGFVSLFKSITFGKPGHDRRNV